MRLLVKRHRLGLAGLVTLMSSASCLAGVAPASAPPDGAGPLVLAQVEPERTARDLEAAIEEIRNRLRDARPAGPEQDEREKLALALAQVEELTERTRYLEQELERARQSSAAADAAALAADAVSDDLAARLAAAERERELLAASSERREREVQAALSASEQALRAEQDQRRGIEAAAEQARQAAASQEVTAAATTAKLQAELEATVQELVRLRVTLAEHDSLLAELRGGQGEAQERQQQTERESAELRQRVDQLVAERDKAHAEAAAASAALEARLADAERQLEAMGEEVRQAWSDRAAAERRIEQVTARAEADRAAAERVRSGERMAADRKITALSDELGQVRARAAALDSVAAAVGARAEANAIELEKMRAVASSAVGEAADLGQQLLEALAEIETLSQLVARIDLAKMTSAASLDPASGEEAPPEDGFGRLKGQVWPVVATVEQEAPPVERPPPSLEVLKRLSGLDLDSGSDGWVRTVAEGIEFELGGDQIGPRSERGLQRVAVLLQLTPGAPVRIVGHTDSQGDEARNLELSQLRAAALRDALVEEFEIDPARIVVEGQGSAEPIASNRTAEGRSANRRVEVFVAR
ncbi:OmpA family protein [Geminicoccus roseus]|uniref:OmpA family protein n=1 Tax=Geminicoccus roseus TaxID=404900 RepID=UPI0004026571|nr:OmpA family protein [Geminicoccus roseus]